jgi:hypothetical protein
MYCRYRNNLTMREHIDVHITVPARESERSLEKYNINRFKRFLFKL